MADMSHLPEAFDALQGRLPEGYTASERLLDPVVVIDRIGGKTIARLGGTRIVRGQRRILHAPTNRHSWVNDGNTLRPLPRDSVQIFKELLGSADANDLPYDVAIRLIRNSGAAIKTEPAEGFLDAGKTVAASLHDSISIPDLRANLFPYQARGVQWMHETIRYTGGVILADEMGLGKTLQVIALLLLERPQSSAPALIICPTSLIANWLREIERFAPDLTVMVHRGPERTGVYKGLQVASVVVTTYETMVNDISIVSSFKWSWVICDEAQAVKNPESNRRRALVTIPRRRAIAITGTPVENSLLDLWSLGDFVIPGLLGSRREFEDHYPDTTDSAQLVGRITDPIVLRRRVKEVADDLPERVDIDLPLELDDNLTDYYLQVRNETIAKYPVAGPLVATLQLQLLCAHPWLRLANDAELGSEDANLEPSKTVALMTAKLERTEALLQEAFYNKQKVILFSIFNKVGDLVRTACPNPDNVFWGTINGSTPQDERQQIIDDFSAHAGPGCLILNPKAAGAGLNITAATVVIHFTPVWNPALEAQASARAHRRGQTRPVTIYRLFYQDTVEQVMIERSAWKRELANESIPIATRDATDMKRALDMKPGKS
ncbi:DEAD/DEAH box helicase [Burkholderia cenocepacia]|uniref:DEAD/DEAH box helicase n=1 Tax=Burkholderia cenocepacia TaxID=95486 RepID=UPI000F5944BD|nr:DEAD/DEAH box helicase [Burkholderia cenocepacia]RQU51582.1 ATP-dependent helicase [Burkholderia cenocepacia]RQV34181.1 ATP-dependent helicase [Burkholderia cenocepacia]